MKKEDPSSSTSSQPILESGDPKNQRRRFKRLRRRSFLKGIGVAGAASVGAGLLAQTSSAFAQEGPEEHSGRLTRGDAALLRFAAAAEILETDFWVQYNELGGIPDSEVPGGSGNAPYTAALAVLDEDMAQYIHDNTDDEFTHQNFLNAYLASKGASTVNLEPFRTLPGSTATGSSGKLRLTNLTQLTLDTSWWTRYRSSTKNPDLGDTFPQAVPTLAVGQHTAIPRTDNDLNDPNFLQAIANTAAFHFPTIEQGGQCASFDCGGSGNWCIRHLSRPEFSAIWWRGFSNQPDHAGTVPIPEPKAPRGFDHSPYPDKRYCHGRGQFPDGDGAFHRPVA